MTDLVTSFERLRTALRPKEDSDGRMGTHGPDCYSWGRGHYECALAEIERLRANAAPQQQASWTSVDEMFATAEIADLKAANQMLHSIIDSQQQRRPLTDEQIDRITDAQWAQNNHKPVYAAHRAYARAIEKAITGEPK
jgi:hypothetical protein